MWNVAYLVDDGHAARGLWRSKNSSLTRQPEGAYLRLNRSFYCYVLLSYTP